MSADLRLPTQSHDSQSAFVGASLDSLLRLLVAMCRSFPYALALFRYCVAHFRWQVQTPQVQAALGSVGLRLLDWQLEVHDALQQPPIVRLYSEPWIYYRAVQGLAPGAVTSAGMLPHQELLPSRGLNTPFGRGLPYRTLSDPTNSEMARLTPAILKLTRKLHLRETRPTLWV